MSTAQPTGIGPRLGQVACITLAVASAAGALRGLANAVAQNHFVALYTKASDRAFAKVTWLPCVRLLGSQLTEHWICAAVATLCLSVTWALCRDAQQENKLPLLLKAYGELPFHTDACSAMWLSFKRPLPDQLPTEETMQKLERQAAAAVQLAARIQAEADQTSGAATREAAATPTPTAAPRGYKGNQKPNSWQRTGDDIVQDADVYQGRMKMLRVLRDHPMMSTLRDEISKIQTYEEAKAAYDKWGETRQNAVYNAKYYSLNEQELKEVVFSAYCCCACALKAFNCAKKEADVRRRTTMTIPTSRSTEIPDLSVDERRAFCLELDAQRYQNYAEALWIAFYKV